MTEYEYYRGKTSELVEKIEIIQNACKHYGFNFSEMLEGFLNSEHIDIGSERVQRDSDTTVVVNVGFVFNLHDRIVPDADNELEIAKGFCEEASTEIIRKGIQSVVDDDVFRHLPTVPDSITINNTQAFYFTEGGGIIDACTCN